MNDIRPTDFIFLHFSISLSSRNILSISYLMYVIGSQTSSHGSRLLTRIYRVGEEIVSMMRSNDDDLTCVGVCALAHIPRHTLCCAAAYIWYPIYKIPSIYRRGRCLCWGRRRRLLTAFRTHGIGGIPDRQSFPWCAHMWTTIKCLDRQSLRDNIYQNNSDGIILSLLSCRNANSCTYSTN